MKTTDQDLITEALTAARALVEALERLAVGSPAAAKTIAAPGGIVSIAPTPIPPGAAEAAAERRAIIRDETGRVAVALIGRGLDLLPECVGDCAGNRRVCMALDGCERLEASKHAMAHDVAQALGLIPTTPGRPNRGTSAERAMHATSRKATR